VHVEVLHIGGFFCGVSTEWPGRRGSRRGGGGREGREGQQGEGQEDGRN
jgi:hypothetical protein